MITLYYLALQGADLVFIFITIGLAFLRSAQFWYGHLRPVEAEIVKDHTGLSLRYTSALGFQVTDKKLLLLCREHQYLTKVFNIPYGSWQVSIHHFTNVVLNVMGMYITVRYFEVVISKPTYVLAPMTSFLAIILEYFETVFIEGANQAYIECLHALKVVTRAKLVARDTTGKRISTERKKYLEKYIESLRLVRATTCGSFYALTRQNLLAFYGQCCDFLVSLLVL